MNNLIFRQFLLAVFTVLVFTVCGCSLDGERSGELALSKLQSSTQNSIKQEVTNVQYYWAQRQSVFTEYYRFKIKGAVVSDLISDLKLSPSYSDTYYKIKPDWWVKPKYKTYRKEKYSNRSFGSRMVFWYDSETGFGYMKISLWD